MGTGDRVKRELRRGILDATVHLAGIGENKEVEIDVVVNFRDRDGDEVIDGRNEVEARFGTAFVPTRARVLINYRGEPRGVAIEDIVAGYVHGNLTLGQGYALAGLVAHIAGFAGAAIEAAGVPADFAFATRNAALFLVAHLTVSGTGAVAAAAVRTAEAGRTVGNAG